MTTPEIETSSNSKRSGAGNPRHTKIRSPRNSKPTTILPDARKLVEPQSGERVTKQERILKLLSRPVGANIEEMMQATGWQQHSLRGFLAGTVKKKLGFDLTSSKAEGEARRYHIETRRGN